MDLKGSHGELIKIIARSQRDNERDRERRGTGEEV
jgi:hypothetical protein